MPGQDNDVQPIIKPEEEATEDQFMAALKAAREAAQVAMATATGSSSVTSLDSLEGNEFHVELNGEVVIGVFRVSGLTSFTTGEFPPLVIGKMVQRDANLPFNQWIRATVESKGEPPVAKLAIVAVDDGEETRRWMLSNARIASISYNTFDTSVSELVEETVTITYDSVFEKWTWSDAQ
jgi:hypothetical protein